MPPSYPDFAEQTRSWGQDALAERPADALEAAATFFRDYARERPEVVALWTFGIGFVLGWKMKPW